MWRMRHFMRISVIATEATIIAATIITLTAILLALWQPQQHWQPQPPVGHASLAVGALWSACARMGFLEVFLNGIFFSLFVVFLRIAYIIKHN
jgi:hypothetical protein